MVRMKLFLSGFACLVAGLGFASNLIVNGDFSSGAKGWLYGGSFGGGEGRVRLGTNGNGNAFLRLEKSFGPGGTQIFSSVMPLAGARRYRLAFSYRTTGGLLFVRALRREDATWGALKGATGEQVTRLFELRPAKAAEPGWQTFVCTNDVPKVVQQADAALQLQLQVYPRPAGVGFFEVDDVVMEPLDAPSVASPPKVSLAVRPTPLETGYRPVEKAFDWTWEIRNGLFYRNGRPAFFCGWGARPGGGMGGAAGLWLARLQGIRFIGTFLEFNQRIERIGGSRYELVARSRPGWISWQREAARFGMLTEPHPLVAYDAHSPLGQFCQAHPEWRDLYFDLGHYLSYDSGTPLAAEILGESFRHYFGHTFPNSGTDYCELAREPGVENCNARMRTGFRAFAQRKYGGDLACANRVWKTDFASWDAVRPLHLDTDAVASSANALALRRHVRDRYPEHYYDCLRFLQRDTALRTRNEMAAVRKAVPGVPVTVDVRGHHSYWDGYMAYDPEAIASLADILHVHCGFFAYEYNHTPVHVPTLCDATAYPLFAYNYFVRNTTKPVVQSEDIISRAGLPGSDGEAMAENDFAQLHRRPWRFRLEAPGEDGVAAAWFAPGFDDRDWGEVTVPGAWDEQPAYAGRRGIGWYRAKFRLDGRLKADYLDGGRRFLIYGKGVAQRGTLWLNGTRVGAVEGWDSTYSFDVGALLNYGGENEIVWRVDGGGYQNGLRFRCHVLCSDMLNKSRPFAEKDYALMYWTYLMRGSSGVLNWNWHDDRLLSYLPDVIAPLETAAGVVLEDLRHRRSKVAYLYGYLSERGLPFKPEGRHYTALTWYNALEFLGTRPDVVSERTFVRDVTPEKYPLLVVPETGLVMDATYQHFKEYLAAGGVAVITTNALRKTFSRFEATDVDTLPGQIVRLPADWPLERLMAALGSLVPEPEVTVESAVRREPALIERMLAGGPDAKVLYLCNWGGLDHPLTVRIPAAYRDWRLTDLRGTFVREADGSLKVTLPSQSPAACLLTRGERPPWMRTEPSPANRQAWRRLAELAEGRDRGRPKALWAVEREYYPYLLDRFDAFGLDNVQPCKPEDWTPELLAQAKVVVLTEGHTSELRAALGRPAFGRMLQDYVQGGGSLYVAAFSAGTINAYGNVLREVAGLFGVTGLWRDVARDEAHAAFGDAWQIASDDVARDSPLTEGVEKVNLFTLSPLVARQGSDVMPVVRIPATAERHAGKLAMAAVAYGKGRVFVSADAMAFQPLRIETADNAALLENVVGWLLRERVTPEMRAAFKANLFVTKEAME